MRHINTIFYKYNGKATNFLCPNCGKGHALYYKHLDNVTEVCVFSCFCDNAFTKKDNSITPGTPEHFYANPTYYKFEKITDRI